MKIFLYKTKKAFQQKKRLGQPSYPRPRARMCDSSSDGMKTLRNSAEKRPPFFMAPVFLMLSVTERRGWRKWNSLTRQDTADGRTPRKHLLLPYYKNCTELETKQKLNTQSKLKWVLFFILLGGNVFGSTGPVGDPVCILHQDVHFPLFVQAVLFRLTKKTEKRKQKRLTATTEPALSACRPFP